ncbi:MAG: type IV secretory system conjugative DNA transfer family protein [Alphaproteobacteria bacterium]|nr:type IV secretory system conjugative DNA transfer family protein [Alphaproteobacteria bacterium]
MSASGNVLVNSSAIKGDNRYFANEALFMHVVHRAHVEETPVPSLRDVYQFTNSGEHDHTQQGNPEEFEDLCQSMIEFDHGDPHVNNGVAARARQMNAMHEKTRSSVLSSANEPFNLLFMDPMVIRNTSTSDFSIKDLMNSDQPSSLYLMFPPSDIKRLGSLFRIFIELFLAQTLGDLNFVDGQAKNKNRYRMLLLMDEFTSIGKLESYEKGLAYMRGYGVKSMVIIQNVGQLNRQEMYTKENAFMSNADIMTTCYSNHPETQQMISRMCGKTTVIQQKVVV